MNKEQLDAQLDSILKHFFGHSSFQEGQKEAIVQLLLKKDLLAIMPTGSGKSLVYQYAGLLQEGVTLIISPLISLMKDQVDKLQQRGIPATFINSTLSIQEKNERLQGIIEGKYKLIYVAPERLRQYLFQEEFAGINVSLLIVDEAHCISQWGHDFRPDYLYIAAFRQFVGNPTTGAFTATATPRVCKEIEQLLYLQSAERLMLNFDRPNIKFEVIPLTSLYNRHKQKLAILAKIFDDWRGEATIIYTGTRRDAEYVTWFVNKKLGLSAEYYHAGLDIAERNSVQDAFVTGQLPITVATNAFGMGIDRPDVRQVIHYNIPGSIEAYYQEVGRAGRDGRPAKAILLYNPQDRRLQEFFITNSQLSYQDLAKLFQMVSKLSKKQRHVWVDPEKLSAMCGFDEGGIKVRNGLQRLEEAGVLEQGSYEGVSRYLLLNSWQEGQVHEIVTQIDAHCDQKRNLLSRMIRYAENDEKCRRNEILRYFGENPERHAGKNCCDVCDGRQKLLTFFAEILNKPEKSTKNIPSIERAILECIQEFNGVRSRKQIIDILLGKLKGYSRFRESRFHGMLADSSAKKINQEMNRVIHEAMIFEDSQGYLILMDDSHFEGGSIS